MLINYSTTDLNSFLSKAEQKLVILGDKLVQQVNWDEVEDSLLDKIQLLTFIIDEIDRTTDQAQIDVLVYFALDYYNLHEIPYAPFSIMPTTIIGSSGGGGGGPVEWDDILNKPASFFPSPHTHKDEDILVSLSGITEVIGGMHDSSFTGTLEALLTKMFITYQAPSFTSFIQDKGASFEIGQNINGTINFGWTISNPTNVKNTANSGSLLLSETSPFTANLPFNLYGTSGTSRTFVGNYTKTVPGSLYIYANGVASNDTSMNQPSVSLTWYSRIWYGNDTDPTVTVPEIQNFNSQLTNSRNVSFTVNGSGYKYVYIPDNINQSGISFYDPVNAFTIDMNAPISVSVTNPQGLVLTGKLYRTVNSLGSALTFNIF